MLMRHAKSSWNDGLEDHRRPLNPRGLRDAPRLGRLINEQNLMPDCIVCSTAVRAHTTAELVSEAAGFQKPLTLVSDLYLADVTTLCRVVASQNDRCASVMAIGHNPGLEEWVGQLSGTRETFPTAALAVFDLAIDRWARLDGQTRGNLVRLWHPKEL